MANHRKSIIDKALLEAEEIDKAFEANAKEILAHTMGSEIEEMVKESLEGSVALTEDDDDGEVELEVSDEIDIDADEDGGELDFDLDLGSDEDNEGDLDIDLDLDIDADDLDDLGGDVETIDLTGSDDSDVIRVFKKMGPDDEIEVVQDGDAVDIKDTATGAEYRVELGGADSEDMEMDIDLDDEDMDMEFDLGGDEDIDMEDMEDMEDEDDDMMGEEIVYEIEITEDGHEDEDMMDEDMDEMDEEAIEEAPRTMSKLKGRKYGNPNPRVHKESVNPRNSKVITENKVLKNKLNKVATENKELKEDYNKLVDALKTFRTKLNEVAVFNSNLTYAVRLFTENSTTKEEKIDIIKRFDEVKSLKESKSIYKQLVKEVSKKAPLKESIDVKINETKGSSSAQITESKVFVHPELEKMKKIWEFNYKY